MAADLSLVGCHGRWTSLGSAKRTISSLRCLEYVSVSIWCVAHPLCSMDQIQKEAALALSLFGPQVDFVHILQLTKNLNYFLIAVIGLSSTLPPCVHPRCDPPGNRVVIVIFELLFWDDIVPPLIFFINAIHTGINLAAAWYPHVATSTYEKLVKENSQKDKDPKKKKKKKKPADNDEGDEEDEEVFAVLQFAWPDSGCQESCMDKLESWFKKSDDLEDDVKPTWLQRWARRHTPLLMAECTIYLAYLVYQYTVPDPGSPPSLSPLLLHGVLMMSPPSRYTRLHVSAVRFRVHHALLIHGEHLSIHLRDDQLDALLYCLEVPPDTAFGHPLSMAAPHMNWM